MSVGKDMKNYGMDSRTGKIQEEYYNRPKGYTGGTGILRIMFGFMLVLGSVGGIEQDTVGLLEGFLWSLGGLGLAWWGVMAAQKYEASQKN